MIVILIAGLIKKILYKMSQYFPKLYEPFGGNIKVRVDLSNYATKDDIKNITHVDTSSFSLKTSVANLKTEVDKLDIDKLVPVPTDLNKLSDVVNNGVGKKSITGLATTSALTAVKNKIPSISNLVKKTDYDKKVGEIDNRMINLTRKIVWNKTKDISIENELKKLKTFDLSYFHGKNYFDEDGNQNYYIFQPISKYLKVAYVNDINYILSWKSRGLNDIKIESIKTNNYLLNPRMDHYDMSKIRIKFNGSFLNRFPPTILHGSIVNIYIVYEITSD